MNYSGYSTPCYYPSATTKNQIIDALARDKYMRKEIEKICKTNQVDDLLQIIFLALLEKDEQSIIHIHQHKKLKFYVIRMVLNQFNSKTSPYYYQTKINASDIGISTLNEAKDWKIEEFCEMIDRELAKLPVYEREMFLLVATSGKTPKQLEAEINIKDYSIYFTFNKVRKKIRTKIRRTGL